MADEYKRLLDWSKKTDRTLDVTKVAGGWSIRTEIKEPVAYTAYFAGDTNRERGQGSDRPARACIGHVARRDRQGSVTLQHRVRRPPRFAVARTGQLVETAVSSRPGSSSTAGRLGRLAGQAAFSTL